jgi:competence protein ComEC
VLLALWCTGFVTGVAAAGAGSFSAIYCAAGAIAAAVVAAILLLKKARASAGAALFFALGLLLAGRAARGTPLHPRVAILVASGEPAIVVARVAVGPEAARRGVRLVADIDSVDGQPASGRLLLSVVSGWPDFGPGEQLRFRARLHEPRGLRNPGLPDPLLGFRATGIDLLAGVGAATDLARVETTPANGPRRLAFRARRAMRAAIEAVVTGPEAAFLRTAVLGERRGVSDEVEDGFKAAGATHVLSVSGLHLAAVSALFFFFIRALVVRIPRLPLLVDPRAVAAVVALPAVGFYTLLTGEAVATQRSALMITVGLTALIVGRSPSAPAALSAAALVLLVPSPLLLFDISLQLSFVSVAGLALLSRPLGPGYGASGRSGVSGVGQRAGHWLWRFGAATLAATAATAPLVAHHFGEFAPASPLGNLALVPLVELLVVPAGLFGSALEALAPGWGRIPLWLASGGARLALHIASVFRTYAPLWLCRMPTMLEALLLLAGVVTGIWGATRGRSARRPGGGESARRWPLLAAVVFLATAGASLGGREIARRLDPNLRVTFLDVGQGDAAVVQGPGGRTIVIDGGGTYDGSFDPGERVVEPFLRSQGITGVDLVILSHAHPDHMNGLQRVLDRFVVGALWTSGDSAHNPLYDRFIATARARGVALPRPAATAWGPLDITPLGPWIDGAIAVPPGMTVNDASLVVRLSFAGRAVLFSGDLEADGEGELVGRATVGQQVNADLLKVPHHGSKTSSSAELLDAVTPATAVISLGWQNRFHFPAQQVLDRYAARGVRVLRTDQHGAVSAVIAGTGVIGLSCQRGCPAAPAGRARAEEHLRTQLR